MSDNYSLTTRGNHEINSNIISELPLSKSTQKDIIKKLKHYKYMDEIHYFRIGSFLRWISLKESECTEEINLTKGALLCNVVITDNGINLLMKYIHSSKIFTLVFDHNIFFQKLNNDEQMIMTAMDLLF
jgi:hypothetical protein